MNHPVLPWWRHYPMGGCTHREPQVAPDLGQDPCFAEGDTVRLIGKPDRPRKILEVKWHSFCHEYVYAVETSNLWCPAYWYAGQLILESEWRNASPDSGHDVRTTSLENHLVGSPQPLNRTGRAKIATDTASILRLGSYISSRGRQVSIESQLGAASAGTVLYLPEDREALLQRAANVPGSHMAQISVANRTTLSAARSLVAHYSEVAALNISTALRPVDWSLSDKYVQGESLARASGLYSSLVTQPNFHRYWRLQETNLDWDRIIYSPHVPVIRDEYELLLDEPWTVNFLTAVAVNRGVLLDKKSATSTQIEKVMRDRTRMVLAVASVHGCDALVLGAWGCGVFQNKPSFIAGMFREVLAEPLFAKRFARIEFAVYYPSPEQSVFNAFQREFG